MHIVLLILIAFSKIVYGCIGGSSTPQTLATRTRALAAPNLDVDLKAAKCEAEHGAYKARDLRRLASLYDFNHPSIPVNDGGSPFCDFDMEVERCSWYNQQVGLGHGFQRARFESFFDLEKFECSSEREFEFRDYFLMAGAEDFDRDTSASIETRIPCQLDKAYLKFDFWSNNETPVLKVCVIAEDQAPSCEESHMDVNPLTFEVPGSFSPFKLRIQVDAIGRDDIVFLDSVRYEGRFCEIISPNATQEIYLTTSAPTTKAVRKLASSIAEIPRKKQKLFGATNLIQNEEQGGKGSENMDICQALNCDFNHGDSCYYTLSGMGATADWRIGEGNKMGNPHTGIRHPNAIDLKMTGFAYVGVDGNDFKDEVFILESSTFSTSEVVYLIFDLYLRSKGPQLRVCINSFDNCPYVSSPLAARDYWRHDQRVLLDKDAEKVFFVAGKIAKHQFLAIDNIRVQNTNFEDYCINYETPSPQ